MGMGSAQAISAAWLTAKMEDHKRPVALAAYVMSIQLANFPGNQLFRTQGTWHVRWQHRGPLGQGLGGGAGFARANLRVDAPRYKRGLIIAASCTIAAAVVILAWKLLYRLFDGGDGGVEKKALEEPQYDSEQRVQSV
jgi:hypothetical protein